MDVDEDPVTAISSLLRNQQDSKKGSPSTWVSFNVRDEQSTFKSALRNGVLKCYKRRISQAVTWVMLSLLPASFPFFFFFFFKQFVAIHHGQ